MQRAWWMEGACHVWRLLHPPATQAVLTKIPEKYIFLEPILFFKNSFFDYYICIFLTALDANRSVQVRIYILQLRSSTSNLTLPDNKSLFIKLWKIKTKHIITNTKYAVGCADLTSMQARKELSALVLSTLSGASRKAE